MISLTGVLDSERKFSEQSWLSSVLSFTLRRTADSALGLAFSVPMMAELTSEFEMVAT